MNQYMKEHAASEGAYPSTEGIAKNPAYASMLLDDYAGVVSETGAILTYIYQHYVTGAVCKNISDELFKIAMTEMHHHEMLGETIIALGGNPVLIDSRCRFWNAREIDYTQNPMRMLCKNIESEQQAVRGYERRICMIRDKCVQEILRRIIADELVHIEIFHELIREINAKGCKG